MSMAIPRPAVIRISVATMGWIPRMATNAPFHRPRATATPRASTIAVATVATLPGVGEPRITAQDKAPAIAHTAPTDRSIPRVAITRVMATAMINVGAPLRAMSTRLPKRCPSLISRPKKPGKKMALTAKSAASRTRGQNSRWVRTPIMPRLRPR